jgi:hypothetical protein
MKLLERVFELHRKHAGDVTRVIDAAIAAHATEIREGKLPPSCAILLAVPQEYKSTDFKGPVAGLTDAVVGNRSKSESIGVKQARAATAAKVIKELNLLKPQMFEDESEYQRLRSQHPGFLSFNVADARPDLKRKILAIQGSPKHIRLAQEIAAAHHGCAVATIQDDWKDYKPPEFRRPK